MQKLLVAISDKDSELIDDFKDCVKNGNRSVEFAVFASAKDVRDAFANRMIDEAWIFSCNDMGAINLVAGIRNENSGIPVYMSCQKADSDLEALQTELGVLKILPKDELKVLLIERLQAIPCGEISGKASEFVPNDVEKILSNDVLEVESKSAIDALPNDIDDVFEPDEPKEASVETSSLSVLKSMDEKPLAKKSAFILSVMSGSGGVGKSTTVATASYLAASRGFSVVVIDCDLQFGDMRQLMGDVPCTSIDDMLIDESLFRSFAKSCNSDLPALVCAPKRLERSEELSNHLDEILDLCASLFDVVFVNTGSSWSEVNAQLIEKSSCNLFLVDQRASSVRSCQHALELCMRMGLATGQFIYALNRCERGSLFCAMDIVNAMQGANVVELKDGGQEVEELLGMGLAGELAASKNDFTNSLNEMLAEVLP